MQQIRGLVRIPFSLIANVSANFILIAFIPAMSTGKKNKKTAGPILIHGHEISDRLSHILVITAAWYSWSPVMSSAQLNWIGKMNQTGWLLPEYTSADASAPGMCCSRPPSFPLSSLCSSHWRLSAMYKGGWLFHYTPHLLLKIVLDCLAPPGFSSLLDPK